MSYIVSIEPLEQYSPFWAKWACATFGIFKLLLIASLDFSDLNDLVGINRAWLYNLKSLSHKQMLSWLRKDSVGFWNRRFMRGLGSILTGGNILSMDFFVFT